MTQPPVARFARAFGVGLASAVLVFGAAGTATAAPGLPEPIATAPGAPTPSVDEQLAQLGDQALPDRWFVEVGGAAQILGGSAQGAKRAQDKVVAAAKAEGITLSDTKRYSTTWNGLAVTASAKDAAKLTAVAGVTGVYAVAQVDQPTEKLNIEPLINEARTMTGADVANDEFGLTGSGVKVGVIDSGIDYNHPAFGGSGANDEQADFPNNRVKWGYDYVGDAYDAGSDDPTINTPMPDEWPDDCGGHGTHVAGIVGASGEVVTGVAPDVDFGAYRVFGCDGSSDSEVIMQAMEDAYADGMDIINMSLGATLQTWPSYPTAQVADRLVDAGVVVVVSQGNAGTSGTFSGGAPGVAHNVITVGSVDNLEYLAHYVATDGGTEVAYLTSTGSPEPEPGSEFTLVAGDPIEACDPIQDAASEDQVVIVDRGTCSFHIKARHAQEAGYEAVIVANNTTGALNMTVVGEVPIVIPAVSILQEDGATLYAELDANGGAVGFTFSEEAKRFENPTGGYQSDFSSYGLTADLTLKPDVSAPGGSIYSTYPLEIGGYATLGGTSMSAPHVAGAAAILLEAKPHLDPYQVRSLLTNTANPFVWGLIPELGLSEPVHRQGGGLIDIPHALSTHTSVSPQKISLGEGEAGPVTTEITITNGSESKVTYTLGVEHGVATYGPTDAPGFYILDADVAFSANTVTVPAGGSATATVVIGESFGVDGAIYGGWVTVESDTEQLVIPFAGLSGDYQALQALEVKALAYVDDESLMLADPFHTFTLADGDLPILALYLAYPVSTMYVDIYEANEDGSKGAMVHSNFVNYATLLDLGRMADLATLAWDGTYQGNQSGNGKVRAVANGDYVLEIRILKALGDPSNPEHWESWDSPALTIERADSTGSPSDFNGPGPDNPNKGKGNNSGKGPKKP